MQLLCCLAVITATGACAAADQTTEDAVSVAIRVDGGADALVRPNEDAMSMQSASADVGADAAADAAFSARDMAIGGDTTQSDAGPVIPVKEFSLVIPVKEIIGGVGPANNAKTNPNGGYKSTLNNIAEFKYPATHGNQWGPTAIVNDHS